MMMMSHGFETFGGVLVFINFIVMTMETDARAVKNDHVMEFVIHANRILLLYYTGECMVRLYLFRRKFFFCAWNLLDLSIVAEGVTSEILALLSIGGQGLEEIGM